MAMRLFSRAEFESYLINSLNLSKTEEKTGTTRFWCTASGKYIAVPDRGCEIPGNTEVFPDFLLNEIIKQIERVES